MLEEYILGSIRQEILLINVFLLIDHNSHSQTFLFVFLSIK